MLWDLARNPSKSSSSLGVGVSGLKSGLPALRNGTDDSERCLDPSLPGACGTANSDSSRVLRVDGATDSSRSSG